MNKVGTALAKMLLGDDFGDEDFYEYVYATFGRNGLPRFSA